MSRHSVEAECKACTGTGLGPSGKACGCERCGGAGELTCSNGGVNCPHPSQCICEAAWEQQEEDKASEY